MNPVDVDGLKSLIKETPADDTRREQEALSALLRSVAGDLREARDRGVMVKTLAEILSEKTGIRVSPERLSMAIKASEIPAREEKPEPKDTRRGPRRARGEGNFIIAAVSPGGELYQLDYGAKGLYAVFQIDENGDKHRRRGTGFPAPDADRDAAIRGFRAWGKGNGYEVFGGQEE
jgi:hypothetical protein